MAEPLPNDGSARLVTFFRGGTTGCKTHSELLFGFAIGASRTGSSRSARRLSRRAVPRQMAQTNDSGLNEPAGCGYTKPMNPSSRQSTGIPALDQHLGGGLLPGTLTVLAGATGIGKTLLGLTFLQAGQQQEGHRGIVFDMSSRGDPQNHGPYAAARHRLAGFRANVLTGCSMVDAGAKFGGGSRRTGRLSERHQQ